MASKNFTGYLRDPLGEYAEFDKWTFTHISTTGETVAGCASTLIIGEDGFYNINIEYGQVNIRTRDTINKNTINQGTYVINSDTLVSTLPALLNAEVPVSDPVILQMEAILEDAETAAGAAEQSAEEAAISAAALNDIRYSKLDNPLTHLFKKNKLVDTLSGDLTWTRASNATYVDMYGNVKAVAIDEPRQEKEGWLIEGASTNLALYSSDFNQAVWDKNGGTTLGELGIAPDGSHTAQLVLAMEDDTNDGPGTNNLRQNSVAITTQSSGATFSLWVKAASGTGLCSLRLRSGIVGNLTKSFEIIDGWKRLAITIATSEIGEAYRIIIASDVPVYIWGAQLEELPFASSYIPTTDSAVTRAADIEAVPYSENIPRGDQPFTFYFKGKIDGYTSINRLFSSESESASERLRAYITEGRRIFFACGDDTGVTQTAPIVDGDTFEYVITSDGVTYTSYFNGIEQNTAPVTAPATELPNELRVLRGGAATNDSYGSCEEFRVYDFALNAAEVAFLAGE